jgi:hypothetical protein
VFPVSPSQLFATSHPEQEHPHPQALSSPDLNVFTNDLNAAMTAASTIRATINVSIIKFLYFRSL